VAMSPAYWYLLKSSLGVCDLRNDPCEAWAFLAVQRLVRDQPGDRDLFCRLVQQALARGDEPMPGGASVVDQVVSSLTQAGIALPAGNAPDPYGRTASHRRNVIDTWTGRRGQQPPAPTRRSWLRKLLNALTGRRDTDPLASEAGPALAPQQQTEDRAGESAALTVWHCMVCGWRCDDPSALAVCKRCKARRPPRTGTETLIDCQQCGKLSLATAVHCEACGAKIDKGHA
jgi:hypothetical protein